MLEAESRPGRVAEADHRPGRVEGLLLELASQQATGALILRDPTDDEATVWFRDGLVYAVSVPGRRPLLGVRLMSSGAITPEALAEALEVQRTELQGWRLGELLVHLGFVDRSVVESFVLEQQRDMMADLLTWTLDSHVFRNGRRTRTDLAPAVEVVDLLAEARDRRAQWSAIVEGIGGPEAVPLLAASSSGATDVVLGPHDWALLCKVDGQRTLSDLADDCGFTLFEAGQVVAGLLAAGLIDLEPVTDEELAAALHGHTTPADDLDTTVAAVTAALSDLFGDSVAGATALNPAPVPDAQDEDEPDEPTAASAPEQTDLADDEDDSPLAEVVDLDSHRAHEAVPERVVAEPAPVDETAESLEDDEATEPVEELVEEPVEELVEELVDGLSESADDDGPVADTPDDMADDMADEDAADVADEDHAEPVAAEAFDEMDVPETDLVVPATPAGQPAASLVPEMPETLVAFVPAQVDEPPLSVDPLVALTALADPDGSQTSPYPVYLLEETPSGAPEMGSALPGDTTLSAYLAEAAPPVAMAPPAAPPSTIDAEPLPLPAPSPADVLLPPPAVSPEAASEQLLPPPAAAYPPPSPLPAPLPAPLPEMSPPPQPAVLPAPPAAPRPEPLPEPLPEPVAAPEPAAPEPPAAVHPEGADMAAMLRELSLLTNVTAEPTGRSATSRQPSTRADSSKDAKKKKRGLFGR